jgi:hypothetical protein
MTSTRLSGVYISEETSQIHIVNPAIADAPLFILESSNMANHNDEIHECKTIAQLELRTQDANIPKSVEIMKNLIIESGIQKWYMTNQRTVTKNGFKQTVINSESLDDCQTIIYIEENLSTEPAIGVKIEGISEGVQDNLENGVVREAYIIPYGTVKNAIDTAENTTPSASSLASLITTTQGINDGHICFINPFTMPGQSMGGIIATEYDEEIGKYEIQNVDLTEFIEYNKTQMLALENAGVNFVRPKTVYGEKSYPLNYGVTSSYQNNSTDGVLIRRRIVNELLREIKREAEAVIYEKDVSRVASDLQNVLGTVISTFAKNECIVQKETKLTVSQQENEDGFEVTGYVKPVGSVHHVLVNMKIN